MPIKKAHTREIQCVGLFLIFQSVKIVTPPWGLTQMYIKIIHFAPYPIAVLVLDYNQKQVQLGRFKFTSI